MRGLSTKGNLRFKIDWASLINGRKFTVFALFYFVFEGNFRVTSLGDLYLEGLIFGILRCSTGTVLTFHTSKDGYLQTEMLFKR